MGLLPYGVWARRRTRLAVSEECSKSHPARRGSTPNREPVLLDLGTTPLQSLDAPDVYGIAESVRGEEYRVSIYRPDSNDAVKGFPVNTDHYLLWEGFPSFLDLSQIVNQCSTSLDPNLEAYVNERVFLMKQRPSDDHWLRDYPPHVRVLVEQTRR